MAKRATPVERDERRRKVAILLIAGVTTNNIAETVAVNRKTVLLDAKAIRAEWAAARIEAYDRYAAEQPVILARGAAGELGSHHPRRHKGVDDGAPRLRPAGEVARALRARPA